MSECPLSLTLLSYMQMWSHVSTACQCQDPPSSRPKFMPPPHLISNQSTGLSIYFLSFSIDRRSPSKVPFSQTFSKGFHVRSSIASDSTFPGTSGREIFHRKRGLNSGNSYVHMFHHNSICLPKEIDTGVNSLKEKQFDHMKYKIRGITPRDYVYDHFIHYSATSQ